MYAATKKWSKVLCIDMERSPRYIVYEKKKVAECWREVDFICVSRYTHIHRHTDKCTNRCAYIHTHTPIIMHILKMKKLRDFPGGSGAKTPRFQCREPKFNPWSGN